MLITLIPGLIVLVLMLVPIGFIFLVRQRQRKQKRSPLSRDLLRSPGESLRKKLSDLDWDMAGDLVLLPTIPLAIYSIHLTQSYLLGHPESILRITFSVTTGVLAWSFLFFRTYKSARTIWKLRLGYEAELAMGQELDQLMRQGAVVFHDVPAEGFNIDHVLVAPNGVFAIETKGRSKPNRNRGKEDAKVMYDGKALNFPTWTESRP
ncbi:MAG: nuclease-related domain-containing protein [Thiobacillaceae bacterium]